MHVWWFALGDTTLDGIALTPEERERAAGFRRSDDATSFLRSRAGLRLALASVTGAPATDLVFDRRCRHCGHPEHGKPRLVGPEEAAEWCFSASRADGIAAVAIVRDRDVGLDVEAVARVRDATAVAASFFSDPERAAWLASPQGEQENAFLRTWCRKEAYVKLRAWGLAAPLCEVDTASWHEDAPAADPLEQGRTVRVRDLAAPNGWVAALVADGDTPLEIIEHDHTRGLLPARST